MKCRPKASIPGADLSISLAGRATIDAMSTDAPCIWPVTAVSLLESLGDGLCALDRQGHITYLNPAAASMLGLEPSQVLGKSMHLLAHTRRPDGTVYPPEECAICAAVRSGAACHIDHEVFWRPDGTSFPAEYSCFPMQSDSEPERIVIRFTDITGRRIHAQEMLSIMASAQFLLWYADVQHIREKGKLRWFLWPADPEAAYRFLPIAISEGQSFAEAFYACRLDEDKQHSDTFAFREILAGRSYRQEYRCRRLDGDVRWIAEDVQIARIGEDRWRAVGVCTDITERKQHEKEIENLNERLRRAMAETHHRVKNNLQVISALIDIQAARGDATIPVSELKRLDHHVRALASIHDLLTQESKAGGSVDIVSVQRSMHKMMPLLQETAGDRPLRHSIDDIRLPIRQMTSLAVLVNELVSNAIKHGWGLVLLTLRAGDGLARLEVSDDGPGFPSGFDPKSAANTGLELIDSLSRWDLQGQVRFTNRPEGGARVTVIFPLPSV